MEFRNSQQPEADSALRKGSSKKFMGWLAVGTVAAANFAQVAYGAILDPSTSPQLKSSKKEPTKALQIGIADFGQYGQEHVASLFKTSENLNLNLVRLTLEHRPEQTQLSPDQLVILEEAQKNPGIDTIYTLSFSRGKDVPITKEQRQNFVHWAQDIVAHGANIVEATNEPNLPLFLNAKNPARVYAKLMSDLYPALHQTNPNVVVIAGSLAKRNAGSFMSRLASELGGKKVADAVSLHYPESVSDYVLRVNMLRRALGPDLPVYISEDASNKANEDEQADQTREKIDLAKCMGAKALVFLQIQDRPDLLPWRSGFVHSDWSQKESYSVLVSSTALPARGGSTNTACHR
jgi:hypothetical protein